MNRFFLVIAMMALPVLASLGDTVPVSSVATPPPPPLNLLPRMYIADLSLDKQEYAIGEKIHGSFMLWNYSTNDTSDIKCQVSIVGLDKTGHVARVIYDRGQFGPIYIAGKSAKKININYPLTYAPADDSLALHVRAVMRDGVSLAWSLRPIKITGGASLVVPSGTYLLLNGHKYHLQEGPTLKASDRASFHATLNNPGSSDITVTPRLVITDKAGTPIAGFSPVLGKTLTVKAAGKTDLVFNIPTKGLRPQTYLAKISLLDANKVRCAPYLFTRFVVEGDIITVTGILADTRAPYQKGSTIKVFASYTGKPFDITIKEDKAVKEYKPVIADIKVELYNEKKELLGSAKLSSQKFNITGYIPAEISLSGDAAALMAFVTVQEKEALLSSYQGRVVYDKGHLTELKVPEQMEPAKVVPKNVNVGDSKYLTMSTVLMYAGAALVTVALVGGLFVFFRRKK